MSDRLPRASTPLEGARDRLLALQSELSGRLGNEPAAIARLRADARDAFAAQGLPTTRHEDWRYTSLAPLAEHDFGLPGAPPAVTRERVEQISVPVFACGLFVFVNGRLAPGLSAHAHDTPLGVESLATLRSDAPDRLAGLGSLADAKRHPFVALNAALLDDGAVVRVPRGVDAPQPIHLVFLTLGKAPLATCPRVWIDAEAGSRATVIADFVSLSNGAVHLRNAVIEARVGENAELSLVTLERGDAASLLLTHLAVSQERDSRFSSHALTFGGRLVRNQIEARLDGEGAHCTLDGLFLAGDGEVADNHTLVDHATPHTTSAELYKGILGGGSRGVFRGRVLVRPDAQKIDASQSNPNLLLDDGAEIDTKPQLEIFADDVKCSHGSAIGRIDPDALFYLRARGLDEPAARRLLTEGFANEILRRLPNDALAGALGELLRKRLPRLRGGS